MYERDGLGVRETGLDQRVGADSVDGLLVGAVDVHEPLAQVRVGREWPSRGFEKLLAGLGDCRFRWFFQSGCLLSGIQGSVRVCGCYQARNQLAEGDSVGE